VPIQLSATLSVADTLQALDYRRNQIPFAAALALTRTAQAVQVAQVAEMRDVFDRPTPWTLKGVAIKPATKTDLRSFIFLKDRTAMSSGGAPADEYLTPEIRGGSRELKRFELMFRSIGVLPSSHFMVPGQGAKLDQYGNMARGQIVQLLSYFQAFRVGGFTANITAEKRKALGKAGGGYFAVQPGASHLKPGIYARTGKSIRPIMMFVSSAHYEAIYDFGYVGKITVEKEWPGQLQRAIEETNRTAR
jgi:hypothetical protein